MKGRSDMSFGDDSRYDFTSPENAERWRGLFIQPLRKVVEQTHPTLQADDTALAYVELLLLRLLGVLCASPYPTKVQDVEERVEHTFPKPFDKWALDDVREAAERAERTRRKRMFVLPADKVHQLLQKEVSPYKTDTSVTNLVVAILEYICTDILKLTGNYVKKISHKSGLSKITCQDVKTAMCADKVLMDMFYQDDEFFTAGEGINLSTSAPAEVTCRRAGCRRGSLTYAELVRDLLNDERSFLRELNLIIRVFKDEIERIYDRDSETVRLIFANIVDIYELTVTLLGNLEDAMEMSQDSPSPYIGSCFEDLANTEEFRVYSTYARKIMTAESRDALQMIADDPELSKPLETAGHGFRLAVKYYLPKLLVSPIAHILSYYDYVSDLLQIAPTPDDMDNLKQVECHLKPIQSAVLSLVLKDGNKLDDTLRISNRTRRQLTTEKTIELSRSIEDKEGKQLLQCCNEFIREDALLKIVPGKRVSDRRAYLFDSFLLLCKPVTSGLTVNMVGSVGVLGVVAGGSSLLKLKERLHLRKLEVIDRPDTEESKNCIELAPRNSPAVVLACGSAAEKRNWMADLVMLNTKSMLDRSLDSILLDLEKKHPLKLPSPEIYRFAIEDSSENIIFEQDKKDNETPQIKGATLLKLVERLTFHVYADLKLMRTFLTTYRTFCEPAQLLDLLIERFDIPEPESVYDASETVDGVIVTDTEKLSKNTTREDWKRYRKEFSQPVKFRVINVLRHWVDQHFYDFERDPDLLDKLKAFLESVDGKPMRKWVESVLKTVQRKTQPPAEGALSGAPVQHVFDKAPPPVERHPVDNPERYNWHPLALNVLETARQLTLLNFDLYRKVKTYELVGAVWTKKDKAETSPNLIRLIKLTTNFTLWLEKEILETENLEERAMVLRWVLELTSALMALNNFAGVVACVGAPQSAAVHRLKNTFQLLPPRLERSLDEYVDLIKDHYGKYKERLKSINPPCVPFCGVSLTEILHIEDGNTNFLSNTELINFSKRQKVADITGMIQQYQNQPYCLTVEPKTRAFLENLDPFPDMEEKDVSEYLWQQGLRIEPKPPAKMPKFPRRYPELSRKSPGLKPSRRHTSAGGHSQSDNADDTTSVSQLSPTSACGWDNTSLASLSLGSVQNLQEEDHKGAALSLMERHFGFLDKAKMSSTVNLNKNATSPCGRDAESTSPRLAGDGATTPRSKQPPNGKRPQPDPWLDQRLSFTHDSIPPRLSDEAEARHQKIVNEIINGAERPKAPALSPRNPIVDASVFYGTDSHNFGEFGSPKRRGKGMSPRAVDRSTKPRCDEEEVPPLLPRGQPDELPPRLPREDKPCGSPPPLLPRHSDEAPPPLPRAADCGDPSPLRDVGSGVRMSPKRSPAAIPSLSPLINLSPGATRNAFSFPTRTTSTPSPGAPPPLTPHHPSCKPPPLPPRRRRDSAPAPPPTPHLQPPVLPPRLPPAPPPPPPAPELQRPAQSTILQRRHHNSVAPRLPPKPPPAAASQT